MDLRLQAELEGGVPGRVWGFCLRGGRVPGLWGARCGGWGVAGGAMRHPGATVRLSLPPHAGGSSHLPIPPPLLFPADICRRRAARSLLPPPSSCPRQRSDGNWLRPNPSGVRTEHEIVFRSRKLFLGKPQFLGVSLKFSLKRISCSILTPNGLGRSQFPSERCQGQEEEGGG